MARRFAIGLVAALAALLTGLAHGAPDPVVAGQLFADAKAVCERDHGRLWGVSICGPILLVDYTDQGVLANQADAGGKLTRVGALFQGKLPDDVIIANTPTEWSGTRWTQIDAPVPSEFAKRRVLLAHELFHRIQPTLKLTRPEAANTHLDTLQGRYLIQLEWRALARAIRATTSTDRKAATTDALAFRLERYRLFPQAAQDEAHLEIAEGVPEYTGVRLGLATDHERRDYAVHDLSAFTSAPTFVRSFAYATGPAYGLLLDRADPAWRGKLNSGKRLDELLAAGMHLAVPEGDAIETRVARYDDGTLRDAEERRDESRRARLAAFRARLVDGPVLLLPLDKSNYQFNPQTLIPLEGYGTVYPTMRLTDTWGALEVQRDGTLIRESDHLASVTAVGADASGASGDGWRLVLNPGWAVQPGQRRGDLIVVKTR